MSPIDLGNMAQYLGPGTGGLWMGEQQRNAMQESELGQKKTLEDILTAQQNRDIAAQKAPLEREQMKANTGLLGAQVGELKGKEEERQRKIKKESYQEFIDGLTQMQDLGGLGEQAGYLNDLSKRTGIPVDHPMFEVALKMRAQGGPAWDNFVKSMKVSPETRFKEEQATARENIQQGAATQRTQMTTDAQRYAADQRVAAAAAKQKQAQDIIQAMATGKVPPQNAIMSLTIMASQAETPEEKAYYERLVQQANIIAQNLANPKGQTGLTVTETGIKPTAPTPLPPTPVAPTTGSAGQTAAAKPPAQEGETRVLGGVTYTYRGGKWYK